MKRALRGSLEANKRLRDKIAQSQGYKDHNDAVKKIAERKERTADVPVSELSSL